MRTVRQKISVILIFVFLASLLIPVVGFAAETPNEDVFTTQSIEISQMEKLSKDMEKYLNFVDGEFKLDTKKMGKDGYSNTVIQTVEKQYQEFNVSIIENSSYGEQVSPNSVPSLLIKKAAQWLKDNWSKVYAKIPDPAKQYFQFNTVSKYIDLYVGISATINEFLTNIVNACLPSWLEWMTPGIVLTIELLLPF